MHCCDIRAQIRIHGDAALPTLIYLPGLHGDWSFTDRFRHALGGRVRFVEFAYPATTTWSLEDHAAEIEERLLEHGIDRGSLLAESFGSQVAWPLSRGKRFQTVQIILAGGFVRHPTRWGARLGGRFFHRITLRRLQRLLRVYARVTRFRFRRSPETIAAVGQFIDSRTDQDKLAVEHRLRLIADNDPCAAAREVSVPVYAVTGLFDPIVPWYFVRRWLRQNCPTLRDYRIIPFADHFVLGTAPEPVAELVVRWMTEAAGGNSGF
jgi:pimeloyl-ACP methyl ester carboxylesterase